jgi:hypothetical protein
VGFTVIDREKNPDEWEEKLRELQDRVRRVLEPLGRWGDR